MKCHHHEPDVSPRYLNVSFKTGNTEIIKHTFAKIPLGGGKCLFQQKDDTWQSAWCHNPHEGHKHGLNKAQKV